MAFKQPVSKPAILPPSATRYPQNSMAEANVLAEICRNTDLIFHHNVDSDLFYDTRHKTIFSAIENLTKSALTTEVDPSEVVDMAATLGLSTQMGGQEYVEQILSTKKSASYFEKGITSIKDAALQRKTMNMGLWLANNAEGKTVDQLQSLVNEQIAKIFAGYGEGGKPSTVKSTVHEMLADFENFGKHRKSPGMMTGIEPLDAFLGGLRPCYFVVGAASSTGKTALLGSILLNFAYDGRKCIFFSQEMTRRQIIARLVARETGVNSRTIDDGEVVGHDRIKVEKALLKIEKYLDEHCEIIDASSISSADIRAKSMSFQRRHGRIDAIFVDYIQVIAAPGVAWGDARSRVEQVSFSLKNLGKDLNCLVFALSQLTPDAQNGAVRPHVDMLRDAKDIRNHADIVMLMSRKESRRDRADGNDIILADFAKGRNIGEGELDMMFIPHLMKFESTGGPLYGSFDKDGKTPFRKPQPNPEPSKDEKGRTKFTGAGGSHA